MPEQVCISGPGARHTAKHWNGNLPSLHAQGPGNEALPAALPLGAGALQEVFRSRAELPAQDTKGYG